MFRFAPSAIARLRSPVRRTTLLTPVALICCLIFATCSPEDDVLYPIPQEGARVFSKRAENDGVEITSRGVKVTAYGSWSFADREASVFLDIANNSTGSVSLDFRNLKLDTEAPVGYGLTRVGTDIDRKDAAKLLSNNILTLPSGQTFYVSLNFAATSRANADVAYDLYLGRKVSVVLPVTGGRDAEGGFTIPLAFRYGRINS